MFHPFVSILFDNNRLMTGDCLFIGSCGRTDFQQGSIKEMYSSLQKIISLHEDTLIYPGHDYIANNLRFTLDREPDNKCAADLLEKVTDQDPSAAMVSTLALEKEINTFFRLHSPSVIARVHDAFPDLPKNTDPQTIFLKLRELRNHW